LAGVVDTIGYFEGAKTIINKLSLEMIESMNSSWKMKDKIRKQRSKYTTTLEFKRNRNKKWKDKQYANRKLEAEANKEGKTYKTGVAVKMNEIIDNNNIKENKKRKQSTCVDCGLLGHKTKKNKQCNFKKEKGMIKENMTEKKQRAKSTCVDCGIIGHRTKKSNQCKLLQKKQPPNELTVQGQAKAKNDSTEENEVRVLVPVEHTPNFWNSKQNTEMTTADRLLSHTNNRGEPWYSPSVVFPNSTCNSTSCHAGFTHGTYCTPIVNNSIRTYSKASSSQSSVQKMDNKEGNYKDNNNSQSSGVTDYGLYSIEESQRYEQVEMYWGTSTEDAIDKTPSKNK
jgi:hypothetical protein